MGDYISLSAEIQGFVDTFRISSCKQTQQIYAYNPLTGIHEPVDEVELSKMIDDYINSGMSALDWTDHHMTVIMKYIRTKAPYYETMGKRGVTVMKNGSFHWKDAKLHKHSPKDRAIASLEVDYDPNAKCPIFDRFISTLANGDSNLEMTLFQIAGCVASHSLKARRLVTLVSSGGSGKSVYLKILEALSGAPYTSNLSISEINNPNRAFDRCALLNSRLNVIHELDSNETLNSIFSANVKKIVSGEDISCERKFGARITFTPAISMILVASNHCPTFESMPSESIRRRLLILNITKTLSPAEQDPDLFKKIKENEMPGIFNKAVYYYQMLKENNFVFASEADSRAFVDEKIIDSFPMYFFVTKHIVVKPGHKLFNDFTRQKYIEWAAKNDIDVPLDKSSLMKKLESTIQKCHLPFLRGKDNGERYLMGIDFKE